MPSISLGGDGGMVPTVGEVCMGPVGSVRTTVGRACALVLAAPDAKTGTSRRKKLGMKRCMYDLNGHVPVATIPRLIGALWNQCKGYTDGFMPRVSRRSPLGAG